MKKPMMAASLVLASSLTLVGCSLFQAAEPFEAPQGLRQGTPVAATQVQGEKPVYPKKGEILTRNWDGQPPLIPHAADKPMNLKRNGCLMCHKPAKPGAKPAKATATHASHFLDGGKKLNNQFYNCTQCHVPQSQIVPEVANSY
ncbi:nitrate reductase cytochrome c-type subunit [Ferrimonas senticii]|uniref:nitrate reductase cytochrome c-type subunit n=1 Tax=Ferrimonas senticii TaxID=394566 RepID=UPI0004292318|nr:nitrate reductase cytochrome c-type subunit [Ferrimonas senticii]